MLRVAVLDCLAHQRRFASTLCKETSKAISREHPTSLHHLFEVPCRPCLLCRMVHKLYECKLERTPQKFLNVSITRLREGPTILQQSVELPTRCHLKAKVDPPPQAHKTLKNQGHRPQLDGSLVPSSWSWKKV